MSSTSKRQLAWYLRNVANSEDATELLTVVLRNMPALSDNDRDWLPLGRGDLPANGDPEHQRFKADLLEQLSIFGEAPCGPEPFEVNALHAAATFHLSPLDLELLRLVLRAGRRVRVKTFGDAVRDELCDTVAALAALLGRGDAEISERLLPEAPLRASGLLVFNEDGSNLLSSFPILSMPDRLARLMVRNYASADAWVAAVVGRPRTTMLDWADFAHLGKRAGLAAKVLRAAAAEGATGVHILLSGPPGTGKTEFAKVLAARAGVQLFAAGEEADKDDDEPSRAERLAALRMAASMLRSVADTAVLLDEAEDVLEGRSSFGNRRGEVSKAFLNRLLEETPRPVVWTTNSLTGMDPATLRRMTLVLEMEVPDRGGRERIWGRVLHQEGLDLDSDLPARLAAQWPASAGVSAAAARAARLSGDGLPALETALSGVMGALGHARPTEGPYLPSFDPNLSPCDQDLEQLAAKLARPGAPRAWSLCLMGLPGTGKTELAHWLAQRIGLPVLQKRASDLLSMWVGGTEKSIAAAFAEARAQNAVLLIDEAEAMLLDRTGAVRSWEVSQVDEMLVQMERHLLPLICTTNLPELLDKAVPRRFTLKLRLSPLGPSEAALAFQRMLGGESPLPLPEGLTPGDFAVVRRKAQLLGESDATVLLQWLEQEAAAKGASKTPVGFQPRVHMPSGKEPVRTLERIRENWD